MTNYSFFKLFIFDHFLLLKWTEICWKICAIHILNAHESTHLNPEAHSPDLQVLKSRLYNDVYFSNSRLYIQNQWCQPIHGPFHSWINSVPLISIAVIEFCYFDFAKRLARTGKMQSKLIQCRRPEKN